MSTCIPQDKIIKVIEIFFPEAKIYLFGSRARKDYTERSDIDIAIDIGRQMTLAEKGRIMTMLDALSMPQRIDVVDLNRAPESLKDAILKEGLVWKN